MFGGHARDGLRPRRGDEVLFMNGGVVSQQGAPARISTTPARSAPSASWPAAGTLEPSMNDSKTPRRWMWVVVSYRCEPIARDCLEALRHHSNGQINVHVVDNASRDGTAKGSPRVPEVKDGERAQPGSGRRTTSRSGPGAPYGAASIRTP